MKNRPHIIIVNPDEMRWDTMGHMGNPAAVTPFLDRFAETEAVSFSNAFCQNPVCVPSRCSFFTGLYPHVHGHRTMSHLLQPGEENLFSELKSAGYHVWMNSRNDLFAGQREGWAESNADVIFYGGNVPKAPGAEQPHEESYSHFEGKLRLDETGKNYTDDDETIDAAISHVKSYEGDAPMCLFLGLNYPHVPYQVEEPYYSAVDRTRLPKRIKPGECSDKSKMVELLQKYQNLDSWTEEEWQELRAVYLGMCMKVDDQFRRLCDGLKGAGIYDDCMIFFFSDHGDFCGDYGLTEKAQSSFEDCLVRVPLLIKTPKGERVDAGITHAMAELTDFYRTVMDYAEVTPKRTQFGMSLRHVLEDRSEEHRAYVFCEGGRLPEEIHCDEYHSVGPTGPPENFVYWPKMKAQTDHDAHAKATMIRSETFKYISRITAEDEFYDLREDPGERRNQIHNPAYADKVAHMQVELMRWYQRTCDVVPYEQDRRFTDEMLWAKVKNSCPREYEQEVRGKIRGGIKQGMLFQYIKELQSRGE